MPNLPRTISDFNLQKAKTSPLQNRHYWIEIDLLRALAAALMIFNHSGVAWFQGAVAPTRLVAVMTFIGSLAPVLFFFATGLGGGVNAANTVRRKPFSKTITKVLILLFADAAMWISSGRFWGLDFLGFIALSTLVLDLIYRSSCPKVLLVSGILGALILRFAIAPSMNLSPVGLSNQLIHLAMGDIGMPGVSYPLCPWIIFPLLGALMGDAANRRSVAFNNSRKRIAFLSGLFGLLGFVFCLYLDNKGMVFFRWGTVSFAYTFFAISGLFTALSLILFLTAVPLHYLSTFTLPGAASLIVVPMHYALVRFVGLLMSTLAQQAFLATSIVTAVFAIYLSKALNQLMVKIAGDGLLLQSPAGLMLTSWLSLALCILASKSQYSLSAMLFAQLLACYLFIRASRKQKISFSNTN